MQEYVLLIYKYRSNEGTAYPMDRSFPGIYPFSIELNRGAFNIVV